MAKKSFTPETEDLKASWFLNFATKIPGYSLKYNIAATEITDVVDSEAHFRYWNNYFKAAKEYMLKVTAYKNEVRDGVPAGAEPSVMPVFPPLGPPPVATAPGGYERAIALGLSMKKKSVYTVADGQDLNLEGPVITLPPASTYKPVITVVAGNNGKPDVKWKKPAGVHGIHFFLKIEGKNGGLPPTPPGGMIEAPAGFNYLGSDTQPHYKDNTPLPAAGQSQVRTYVAIYFVDEENIGQYSNEVKFTVTGVI